jgi:tetratricopeptide (TPR) repeat protein
MSKWQGRRFGRGRWLGLFCALFLAWGPSAPAAEADDCRNGDIATCTTAINAATETAAKAELLTKRAQLLRRNGDLEGAEADIDAAMALAPDNADILVELGYLRRAQGDIEGALAAQTEALKVDPQSWRALLNRMDSLASLGRNADCLAEAPRAIELAPDQPYTYAYRGRCRAGLGQTAEALEDYEKAAVMGLDAAFLYRNIALARLNLGRYQEALEAAQIAVQRDPANEYGQYAHVDALLQLGRFDEAITAYHEAVAVIDADTLGFANLLAWELYRGGRAQDALPIIEDFFSTHPEPGAEQVYEVDTYAHILAALGNKEKALQQFLVAADLGGAEKQAIYRQQLGLLKIVAAPGREGLAAALAQCVELGAGCRLSD